MKRSVFVSVIALLAAALGTPPAAEAGPVADAPADYGSFVDSVVDKQLDEYQIPGAAVVVVDRRGPLFTKGYGLSDVDRRTPVSAERSGFFIASTAKLWTTTAVMQLAEQGEVDLDADVNRYLKDFKIRDSYPGKPVTLSHLLTHTAGFVDDIVGVAVRDPADVPPLGEYLAAHQPDRVRPPGTLASYDNYGFALAGYVVEVVSGQSFDSYVTTQILLPLGMSGATAAQPHPAAVDATRAHGYRPDGDRQVPVHGQYGPQAPTGAGVVATATDMGRFLTFQLAGDTEPANGKRVLSAASVHQMQTRQFTHDPRLPGMAFGWEEHPRNGHRVLSKDGDVPGFHSNTAILPDKGIGIFVAYNGDGVDGSAALANKELVNQLIDRFYPGTPPAADRHQPAPGELDRYAGSYRVTRTAEDFTKAAALLSSVSVTVESDGTLTTSGPLSADPEKTTQHWVPVAPRQFREKDGQDELAFRLDDDGAVTALVTTANPAVAYERLTWWQSPTLHQMLLLGSLLILIPTLLYWPIAALVRRLRRRSPANAGNRWARAARLAAWLTAALVTAFLVLFTLVFADGNKLLESMVLGTPPLVVAALALATTALVFTIAATVGTVAAWQHRWWTLPGRLHHTAATLAAIAFLSVGAMYHLVIG